jgi:hypothetical protein
MSIGSSSEAESSQKQTESLIEAEMNDIGFEVFLKALLR